MIPTSVSVMYMCVHALIFVSMASSRQGRSDLHDGEVMGVNLDHLLSACWLQIREGRIQDFSLIRKCRDPLQVRPALQLVFGGDLKDE
jgi:hypothetical protein